MRSKIRILLAGLFAAAGMTATAASPVVNHYTTIPLELLKTEGTLIFSDCPEYADNPGILYEGTVKKGKGRVYYYHVNQTGSPARLVVYAKSRKKQDLIITRTVKGDESRDYISTGATLSFREVVKPKEKPTTLELAKNERTILFEDNPGGIDPDMLVSGMVEIETEKPVTLGTAILPDGSQEDLQKSLDTALRLPADSHEMRGTFAGDLYLENKKPWDFQKGPAEIVVGKSISFRTGRDEMSRGKRENTGDYGIVYHISFHTKGNGKYRLYVNPQGGVYMGTFRIGHNEKVPMIFRTDTVKRGKWFGNGTDQDYMEAGTWEMGRDLYFRFIPAGAAYLPLRFLMVPVEE